MSWGITRRDHRSKNAEPAHTLSYCAAHASMRILELENRCTGNRTVGSNPTLSARTGMKAADFSHSEKVTYKCTYKCLRSGGRKAVGSLSAMIHWEGFSTVPCIHKSRSVSSGWSTSALLPKADIGQRIKHVCVTLKRAKCSGKLHRSARRRLPPAFVLTD